VVGGEGLRDPQVEVSTGRERSGSRGGYPPP
ncbi:hypothetical protein Tco_0619051, partial [Tanacetum coccineum]